MELNALKIVQGARDELLKEHWTDIHREAFRVLCAVCMYLCGGGRTSSVDTLYGTMDVNDSK